MVANYLKDVSTMLATVSAVGTRNIIEHLQAERQMLKLIFAFDHINYARYNSFHHVFFSNLSQYNPQALKDLFNYGFEVTSSVETLREIHGNLVIGN